MTLAYPGPTTTHGEIIATRAFIDALRNKELAMKVREREPTSLDNAYNLAMKLEGYQKAELKSSDSDDRRPARVKAVKEVGPSMKEFWKIVDEMQEQFRQMKEQLRHKQDRVAPSSTSDEQPSSAPVVWFWWRKVNEQSPETERGHTRCRYKEVLSV